MLDVALAWAARLPRLLAVVVVVFGGATSPVPGETGLLILHVESGLIPSTGCEAAHDRLDRSEIRRDVELISQIGPMCPCRVQHAPAMLLDVANAASRRVHDAQLQIARRKGILVDVRTVRPTVGGEESRVLKQSLAHHDGRRAGVLK